MISSKMILRMVLLAWLWVLGAVTVVFCAAKVRGKCKDRSTKYMLLGTFT